MAIAWKDVIAKPEFQQLSEQEKAAAQEQYFREVVAPQAGSQAEQARAAFFAAYPAATQQSVTGQDLQASGVVQQQQMPDLTADELSRLPENPAAFAQTLSQPNAEWVQRQYQLKSDLAQQPQTNAELLARSAGNVGKGILQAGVNVANILPEVTDIFKSAGAAAAGQLGLSDGTYYPSPRLELPEELKPQSTVSKLTSEVLPYLLPTGVEKLAAKAPGAAAKVTEMIAENLPGALAQTSGAEDGGLGKALAEGAAGSAAGRAVTAAAGKVAGPVVKSAREWLSPTEKVVADATEAARAGATTSEAAQQQAAGEIGKAVTAKDYSSIAGEVKPDERILKAAQQLDMDGALLPSHYSQSQTYRAVEQGLKSIPASQLKAKEYETINQLAQKADDLIGLAGGTTNKVGLSEKFKAESSKAIDELTAKSDAIYDEIGGNIPKSTRMRTDNTVKLLMERAKDAGGVDKLSTLERKLLGELQGKRERVMNDLMQYEWKTTKQPVYGLVDQRRKEIGAAIGRNEGPFKDQITGNLKQLYASLTDDQEKVAQSLGMGDKWGVAKGLVKQRKDLEDHMVTALGKDLSGTFTSKLSPAIQRLRKGDVQAFDKLIEATPPSMRQEVVASALNDVFTLGSRKEQQLSIPGFVDWYAGAKKSGALDRVMKHLPPEARRNLSNIHKVSAGIRKANEEAISTGRLNTLIESIDGRNGVLEHLYGAAEKGAAVAGGSIGAAAAGAPGAAIGTALGAALGQAAGKKLQLPARSIAADALMADPKFQQALIKATEKNKKTASKVVENLPAWRSFAGHLSGDEAKQVARVGALAWLNNDIEE